VLIAHLPFRSMQAVAASHISLDLPSAPEAQTQQSAAAAALADADDGATVSTGATRTAHLRGGWSEPRSYCGRTTAPLRPLWPNRQARAIRCGYTVAINGCISDTVRRKAFCVFCRRRSGARLGTSAAVQNGAAGPGRDGRAVGGRADRGEADEARAVCASLLAGVARTTARSIGRLQRNALFGQAVKDDAMQCSATVTTNVQGHSALSPAAHSLPAAALSVARL
jgi:hypothetical protein